jgi:SAM-dependent methyltransferase
VTRRLPPLSLHAWLRYDAIQKLLPEGVERVLEVGAGQGSVGALLVGRYDYFGLEPDAASFAVAARRVGDERIVQRDDETFVTAEPFDLVCAFEVLEHLEDDVAALRRWRRFLRPGGWALVSVPAGRDRMGAADRRAGHLRRYDRVDLEIVLMKAGFIDPTVLAYGFPLGHLLEAGRNVVARDDARDATVSERTAASGRWLQPPDWAARATQVASLPFRLLQRPFAAGSLGTGFVARARMPA